ncbi:MAG: alpha/beta fold hydrolase [Xanthomonadales bacterium]|nr:alpha/beta fold hydrolase [Xanthomonadales bacterium]
MEFRPPLGLRNPHVQSALRSSRIAHWKVERRARALLAAEQEWILDCGDGVRLQGFYSAAASPTAPTVALLHGWEGSAHSNYMLGTGARLLAAGMNVFRLNFRDHGDTHELNPGVFHSCRLDEVLGALADMQRRTGARDWGIAGFSLGGNFALRVALHGPARGLALSRCVAICPVLDPEHVLKSMETGPRFYEKYYNRKWAGSLRRKQACFPDRYDYDEWYGLNSMRERTAYLATRYYGFSRVEDYFDGYSIAGDRLAQLTVPSTILTSADDPVVPVADVTSLPDNPCLEVVVTGHGGHCGYLENWWLDNWAEPFICQRLSGQAGPGPQTEEQST